MTGNREPRDVEARLRASLNAYAEAVDEQPAPPVPVAAGARDRSAGARVAGAGPGRGRGARRGGGCLAPPRPDERPVLDRGAGGGDGARRGLPSRVRDGVDHRLRGQAGGRGAESGADAAVPAEVGVAHPLDLYTHCGIFGADVGGVWFAADPPLVEGAGPPAGWGDPYQPGTLTLESADEAVFRDDAGHELSLRAAPDSERPPPCD